jgi:hypothetical protein
MSNKLIIHIKLLRNNCFLIISNDLGKILFIKNAGCLGFKNIYKREVEVLTKLLISSTNFILSFSQESFLFLKLEGLKKYTVRIIYKQLHLLLKNYNVRILNLKIVNKVVHNGCRKKSLKL